MRNVEMSEKDQVDKDRGGRRWVANALPAIDSDWVGTCKQPRWWSSKCAWSLLILIL